MGTQLAGRSRYVIARAFDGRTTHKHSLKAQRGTTAAVVARLGFHGLGAFGALAFTSMLASGCSCATDGTPLVHDAGALLDATNQDDAAPPTTCDQRFDALPDACETDDDCALVVQTECLFAHGRSSRALGISRTALAEFNDLAHECNLPTFDNASARCALEGGSIAAARVDGETPLAIFGHPMAVRCDVDHCVTYRSTCGPSLCGNATIDACSILETDTGPVFSTTINSNVVGSQEGCDGALLGGASCESEGFGGGVLACVADACFLDNSRCHACVDTGGSEITCVDGGLDTFAPVTSYAVAVSDAEIAIVSIQGLGAERTLEFARFDASLTLLGRSTATPQMTEWTDVGLVRGSDGWMMNATTADWSADANRSHTDLHTFDVEGNYEGVSLRIEDASASRLVAGGGAMPLLVYSDSRGVAHSVTLGPDLSTADDAVDLGRGVVDAAVFVGDGYLLAIRSLDEPTFTLQRVELDGTVVTRRINTSQGCTFPQFVVNDLGVWLMFTYNNESSILIPLGSDGDRAPGSNDVLVPVPLHGATSMIGWGDSILLAWGRDGHDSTESVIATLDQDGVVSEPTLLVRYPSVGATKLFAQGDHAILAAHGILPAVATVRAEHPTEISLARINHP